MWAMYQEIQGHFVQAVAYVYNCRLGCDGWSILLRWLHYRYWSRCKPKVPCNLKSVTRHVHRIQCIKQQMLHPLHLRQWQEDQSESLWCLCFHYNCPHALSQGFSHLEVKLSYNALVVLPQGQLMSSAIQQEIHSAVDMRIAVSGIRWFRAWYLYLRQTDKFSLLNCRTLVVVIRLQGAGDVIMCGFTARQRNVKKQTKLRTMLETLKWHAIERNFESDKVCFISQIVYFWFITPIGFDFSQWHLFPIQLSRVVWCNEERETMSG